MSEIAVLKRNLDSFLELPLKFRKILMDIVQPDDRDQLTQYSASRVEIGSKIRISGMEIEVENEKRITLSIVKGEGGFTLNYFEEFGKQYLMCSPYKEKETLWRLHLQCSNLLKIARKNIEYLMELHQNKLKSLTVKSRVSFKLGVLSMDNLEHLYISGNFNISEIISSIRKPIKTLEVQGDVLRQMPKKMIEESGSFHLLK